MTSLTLSVRPRPHNFLLTCSCAPSMRHPQGQGTGQPSQEVRSRLHPRTMGLALHKRPSPSAPVQEVESQPAGCPRGERDQEEAVNESPPPIRRTRYRKSWTPDAGACYFNTSLTGRGMVLRKDRGLILRISWTLDSIRNSIEPTLTNQPLAPVEGLGVVHLLVSGAARRRGALSQIRPLWLSPTASGGHPLPSTSVLGLHFP
ncbi:uncharacterized protein [Sinocyclocheilus grahami]|uniref:uncharacterized protein n=1 Tax=Sinocyclocheilus grahami TaxID=75366 RepID=UPI0007ACF051|nr:PREDICTED: uncharacterized protein LOC107575592 [Sinocyclocheilus grahami]